MSGAGTEVDAYFNAPRKWRRELQKLREILLDAGLSEEFKWRSPCYTHEGRNVVIIGELKDSCTFSFFKGALLRDPKKILRKPGENSRSARVIRFTSVDEIVAVEKVLTSYIQEAIEAEKAGLKVDRTTEADLDFPDELLAKLEKDPALKTAFDALTPGRQRAYVIYFAAAKQAKTRAARVDKYTQRILDVKGLNDCVCGHSRKLPYCDGSHKHFR